MINRERMLRHFLDLVQIDSESRHERAVAERLKADLNALGAETGFDDAGEKVGGDSGNLLASLPSTASDAMPLFLSAHMDTVGPGRGVKPVVSDGAVRTDGTTILGGDDKAGCAIIVEVLRVLAEHQIPHGGVEAVFTICEEQGLLGAKHFDTTRVRARHGVVLDSEDARSISLRGPATMRMEWMVRGLEAHAGVEPEKGISAIKIAAEAIGAMRLGRLDAETTANIGVIEAPGAMNVVPRQARVLGEARSRSPSTLAEQTAHMSRCFHDAVAKAPSVTIDGETRMAALEERIELDYEALDVDEQAVVVRRLQSAATSIGVALRPATAGGGCDANIFNQRGLECVNLGTGMRAIHTLKEWLDLEDFYRSADIVLALLKSKG